MTYLKDDANTNSIELYQSKMGFDSSDSNFVFANIHIMRNSKVLNHTPQWLKKILLFSQKEAKWGVLAFQQTGLLVLGLDHFKAFADDFSNVQYSFNGNNLYIPVSEMYSIKLKDHRNFELVTVETNHQLINFIVPSKWNALPFQESNYKHLPELVQKLENH